MIISVTCAVIIQEGRLLIAQRTANGAQALKWELPGGKVESGETRKACLKRELLEELDIEAKIGSSLPESIHQYSDKTIRLFPYYVTILKGIPKPLIHEKIEWIPVEQALSVDWSEADIPIIKRLLNSGQS